MGYKTVNPKLEKVKTILIEEVTSCESVPQISGFWEEAPRIGNTKICCEHLLQLKFIANLKKAQSIAKGTLNVVGSFYRFQKVPDFSLS